ncbi:MAG TPA: class 1 fructose-bisphosphatase [Hyphomicrobium sp.]|nr:class 1 fructose-bisphosphatase [Hyphomicrobium sp.]
MAGKTITLTSHLEDWALGGSTRQGIAKTVLALTASSIEMSERVAKGRLGGTLSRVTARAGEFDEQKEIDVLANESIVAALRDAPVAALASEEAPDPILLNEKAPLLVATDPLDGSSNVDANVSFGMIFSVLPRHPSSIGEAAFLRPGSHQLAAGIIVYGPQTVLALTVGNGTNIFTLDRETKTYILAQPKISIPVETTEYAINASNARHWDEPIRIYVHDCENGADGPRGHDYNMRWTGSPVADVFRILSRGGIYLYPGDSRKDFHQGRIRLIYEANPIGWLIEQAGGRATTGYERLLDIVPTSLHQKTPIICGSRDEVDRVSRLYTGLGFKGEHSPLFGRRGLFRAMT